jgi:hypothetical protein
MLNQVLRTHNFVLFFESESCYVAQAGLELNIFLPQTLKSTGIAGMYHHAWLCGNTNFIGYWQ